MPLPNAIPAESLSPQLVGNAFVEQYYKTLLSSPESVHRFYKESSSLTRPDTNGVLAPVSTVQGQDAIENMVMSLDYYKDCRVEVATEDAQLSQNDGVFILVSGYLIGKDKIRRKFSQSFFLASEGSGVYFVLNDMVRFVDDSQPEEVNQVLPNGSIIDVSNDPPLPGIDSEETDSEELSTVQDCEPRDTASLPPPSPPPPKRVPENGEKVHVSSEKAVYTSVKPGGTRPEKAVTSVKPSGTRLEKNVTATVKPSVTQPVPKVTHPIELSKKTYASILKVPGSTMPMPNFMPTTTATPALSATPKPVSGPPKPLSGPAKPLATSTKPTPTTEILANGGTNDFEKDSSHDEGFSIYVGNMPPDTTIDQVVMQFEVYGPIKPDGVQVKRHQYDGFCFAFVEFKSVKSMEDAIQASPVRIGDRQAYIQQKKTPTRVRNGVVYSEGWRGNYPPGNGGYRNQNFRDNGGFAGNIGPGRNDFRNQGPNGGQGFQQRAFQNWDARPPQQHAYQNGDGRPPQQQRTVQNGDGRPPQQQRAFQNGEGRPLQQQRPYQNGDVRLRPFQNVGGRPPQQQHAYQNGDGRPPHQQRDFQNGYGRPLQQHPFQNGDGRPSQQRPFQNGDGRPPQQCGFQNGDRRTSVPRTMNQGNRPIEVKGG